LVWVVGAGAVAVGLHRDEVLRQATGEALAFAGEEGRWGPGGRERVADCRRGADGAGGWGRVGEDGGADFGGYVTAWVVENYLGNVQAEDGIAHRSGEERFGVADGEGSRRRWQLRLQVNQLGRGL
jgi:hypothetical protein